MNTLLAVTAIVGATIVNLDGGSTSSPSAPTPREAFPPCATSSW